MEVEQKILGWRPSEVLIPKHMAYQVRHLNKYGNYGRGFRIMNSDKKRYLW